MTHRTIQQILDERAKNDGTKPFLINNESNVSYAQARNVARAIAESLHEKGYAQGQSIGFAGQNSVQLALSFLGVCYGGFRATAINLVAGPSVIQYVLEHANCKTVLADSVGREKLAEVPSEVCPPIDDLADLNATPKHTDLPALEPDDDGLLMYTSGTTGKPKGVRLSHQNLLAGGANTAIAHELGAEDRAYCTLPLYHINGLCVTLMAPLFSAGSVVFSPKFSTKDFWACIARHRATWFSVVPTQIGYLLNDDSPMPDMPLLRFGRSASAPLSPEIHRAFEQRFGIPMIETMGLTETAAQILSNPMPPKVRKIGSPGIAYGNEIKIIDGDGRDCSIGQSGELCIRGDNVMKGYLHNFEATKEALDADGWLHTGDLGKMDSQGYVFVTGRLKELIIKGGENIAPREIDEALLSHPSILEAAAFAIDCKRYGQTVSAAVVIKPQARVSVDALLKHCSEQLGAFKTPVNIHLLEALPKGPSGKVQRLKLAESLTTA